MSLADFDMHIKDAREAAEHGRIDAAKICARWAGIVVGRDGLDLPQPFSDLEGALAMSFEEGVRMAVNIRQRARLPSRESRRRTCSAAAMSEPREGEDQ